MQSAQLATDSVLLLLEQVDHLKLEVARLMALVPGAHINGKDSDDLVPPGGKDTVV